jgi:hypothetical protein
VQRQHCYESSSVATDQRIIPKAHGGIISETSQAFYPYQYFIKEYLEANEVLNNIAIIFLKYCPECIQRDQKTSRDILGGVPNVTSTIA